MYGQWLKQTLYGLSEEQYHKKKTMKLVSDQVFLIPESHIRDGIFDNMHDLGWTAEVGDRLFRPVGRVVPVTRFIHPEVMERYDPR